MFNHENSNEEEAMGKIELPEEIVKLEAGLRETAEWLRQNDIPVDDECRLVMDEYANAGFDLAEIEADKKNVERAENDFAEKRLRQGGVEKAYTLGEQLERFATVLMAKFFKEQFLADQKKKGGAGKPMVVARTARPDDIDRGIDYVIFDPNSGAIMGAVDVTVGEIDNAIYDKKEKRITDKNVGGRGELKYGLDIDRSDSGKKIILKSRKDVPVFLLNLPKADFEKYLQKIDYDNQDMSKLEDKIIDKFLDSIVEQIEVFKEAGWAKNNPDNMAAFAKIEAIYNRRMINS